MKSYNYEIEKEKPIKVLFENEYDEIMASESVLIQVFSGEEEEEFKDILFFLKIEFPHATIISASTDGEIYENKVLTYTTVVSVSLFKSTQLKTHYVDKNDGFKAGALIAKKLVTPRTKLLIAFADGINTNGEKFLNGIYSIAQNIKIAGGLSGDNGALKECFIGIDNKLYNNGIVAVALDSDILQVQTLYNFGWRSIGLPHKITSSEENRVYSIDGISTVDFYTNYLGKEISSYLPAIGIEYPLIMKRDNIFVARAALSKHKDGSLSFAGDIPEGVEVYIGVGAKEEIIKNPISKKSLAVESFFIFSCMARRRFLPDLIENEIEYFSQIAPTSGFFTYGEFYTDKKPELLNQTLTAVALSEVSKEKKVDLLTSEISPRQSHNISQFALLNLLEKTSQELFEVTRLRREDIITSQQTKLAQMGEMVAMIAHQWRQPLNAISAASIKLNMQAQMDLTTADNIEETTSFIEETTQNMSKMINDFINFTKPSNKKELVKLKDIIDDILQLMGVQLKNHDISLTQEFNKELSLYLFSKDLEHVLINLFSNARDAFEGKNITNKKITVDAFQDENNCIIEVSDNAGGIEEKIITRLFEPYFTTKEQGKGTGLGLYMSKKLIETNLNGSIECKNSSNGASFIITLKNSVVNDEK